MTKISRCMVALAVAFTACLAVGSALAGGTPRFAGAYDGSQVRPNQLRLTVDGTLHVGDVHWSSWGGSTARGTGEAEYHGCTPNCGTATPHYVRVTIALTGIQPCHGHEFYTHVRLTKRTGGLLDASYLARSWSPCVK